MKMAAYESDRLSTRTSRGKRIKASKGEVDRRRSFGYERDGITLNQSEAAIIRECAQRLLAGESQQAIMRELSERGVTGVTGIPFDHNRFRRIMMRPRNAGFIVHQGNVVDGVRLPQPHILDEASHVRLVAMYTARKSCHPASADYLLSGIASCGHCGGTLTGKTVQRSASSPVYRHYRCKHCLRTHIRCTLVDEWTYEWTITTLSDPKHADAIARAATDLSVRRNAILSEMTSCEALADAVAQRLGAGEITLSRYDAVTGPLDARLVALRSQLAAVDGEAPAPEPTGRVRLHQPSPHLWWLAEWEDTDTTVGQRRAMVLRALNGRRLIVGPAGSASRVSVVPA
jgi:hypothetical protein